MNRKTNKYTPNVFDPFDEGFTSYEEIVNSELPSDFSPVRAERDQIILPQPGTDLNAYGGDINFLLNYGSGFYLPSRSRIRIDGRLVKKSDGGPFGPDASGGYPDVALTNNFFPYLFSRISYNIGANSEEVENFDYPGQVTTMKHLLTRPKTWDGLDKFWIPDTFDGNAPTKDFVYSAVYFPMSELPAITAGGASKAEYQAFMKGIIPIFNIFNPENAAENVVDADLPCAADAGPTNAEIKTGFDHVVDKINATTDSEQVNYIDAGIITGKTPAVFKACVQELAKIINKVILIRDPYELHKNTGFVKRKDALFDPVKNVITYTAAGINNMGIFSYEIPLSMLFNFCEDYDKIFYNIPHKLMLRRAASDDDAIFKSGYAPAGAIAILNLTWLVPVLQLNPIMEGRILEKFSQAREQTCRYICKRARVREDIYGLSNITFTEQTEGGFNRPRLLAIGFQSYDKSIPTLAIDAQSRNQSIFNGVVLAGRQQTNIDIASVTLQYLGGTPIDLTTQENNFGKNIYSTYYRYLKNFMKTYTGDPNEDYQIDFNDFRNLYRLYCFDISDRIDELSVASQPSITFDIKLNNPIPSAADAYVRMFLLIFYDREVTVKYFTEVATTLKR